MARAAKWFNDNKLAIMLISGVDCLDRHLTQRAIPTSLLSTKTRRICCNYYSVAFTAYAKCCQTIGREMSRRFLPGPSPTVGLFPLAPGQVFQYHHNQH